VLDAYRVHAIAAFVGLGALGAEPLDNDPTIHPPASPITSGTKRSVGVIWTREKVIHYMDGIAVAESDWPINTQYPHQLGINLSPDKKIAARSSVEVNHRSSGNEHTGRS
jgi:hypothetical protein